MEDDFMTVKSFQQIYVASVPDGVIEDLEK
jgi:hypothetical protein